MIYVSMEIRRKDVGNKGKGKNGFGALEGWCLLFQVSWVSSFGFGMFLLGTSNTTCNNGALSRVYYSSSEWEN